MSIDQGSFHEATSWIYIDLLTHWQLNSASFINKCLVALQVMLLVIRSVLREAAYVLVRLYLWQIFRKSRAISSGMCISLSRNETSRIICSKQKKCVHISRVLLGTFYGIVSMINLLICVLCYDSTLKINIWDSSPEAVFCLLSTSFSGSRKLPRKICFRVLSRGLDDANGAAYLQQLTAALSSEE